MAYTTKNLDRILPLSNRELARRNYWAEVHLSELGEKYPVWSAFWILHSIPYGATLSQMFFENPSLGYGLQVFAVYVGFYLMLVSITWLWHVRRQPNRALYYLECLRKYYMYYDAARGQWEPVHIRREIQKLQAAFDNLRRSSEDDKEIAIEQLQQQIAHLQEEGDRLARLMTVRIEHLSGTEPSTQHPTKQSTAAVGAVSVYSVTQLEGALACVEPTATQTSETQKDESTVSESIERVCVVAH